MAPTPVAGAGTGARQRLLGGQKRLLEEAAFYVRDAIDHTTRVHPADSRRARWAYGVLIGSVWPLVRSVAIWGMIVLSFFEMPTWCLHEPDACHPGTDLSAFYPRVTPRFLPRPWSIGLEFAALVLQLGDYVLQVIAEGRPRFICHPWRRGFWHQLLLGVSFLSLLMTACFPTAVSFRGGPFLRVLFLVVFSPRLRQEMRLTLRILPQFGKALVLLLAIFLLYAVLGLSLFSPYSDDKADAQEGSIYFKDFKTAFASVWQLFLYWTFPSIMILRDPTSPEGDVLPPNWVQCVFVFSFMIITIYLLLNLGLAIVCDVYAERNEALGEKREQERKQNLEAAYALLLRAADAADGDGDLVAAGAKGGGGGGSGVPTYLVEGVLSRLASSSAAAAAASGPARLTRRGVAAVIEDLDPEADGFISRAAFMALPETLVSNHERHNHSGEASPVDRRRQQQPGQPGGEAAQRGLSPSQGRAEEGKLQEGPAQREQLQQRQGYTHRRLRFVDLWCPRLARHGAFERVERVVRGPYLDGFINLVIVANLVLACFAHGEHPSSGQSGLLSHQEFTYVCALIFTAEVTAKLFVLGWKRYAASYVNIFDFVLTLLSVGGAAYELARGEATSGRHHALLLFELLRVLRLCRALLSVPVFRSTAATFAGILPVSTALLLNLFALTFAFAAVGLEAYGGLVNKDPASPWYDELQATYYWQNGLYVFNLNDLGGCFIVLVELLIDSSLIQPFADALAAATPRASRRPFISIYFIVYYVIGQLVLLNVLVAFILDAFMDAQAKDKGSKEEEEEQEGESKGAAAAAGAAGVN